MLGGLPGGADSADLVSGPAQHVLRKTLTEPGEKSDQDLKK
jgi:hypothetical protein